MDHLKGIKSTHEEREAPLPYYSRRLAERDQRNASWLYDRSLDIDYPVLNKDDLL